MTTEEQVKANGQVTKALEILNKFKFNNEDDKAALIFTISGNDISGCIVGEAQLLGVVLLKIIEHNPQFEDVLKAVLFQRAIDDLKENVIMDIAKANGRVAKS